MGRLFIGREKHSFHTLDSTNNFAAKLLSLSNPVEGTVIMAHHQTAGKGQRSKSWLDEEGKNLLISVILRPNFLMADQQSALNKTIALAVHDTVKAFSDTDQVKIKWPNDILVGDLKIAGLLIENSIRSRKLESSIVGVGLNVMQMEFGDLEATSLALLSQRPVPVEIVKERLLNYLEHRYLELKSSGGRTSIEMEYLEKLYGLHQTRKFLYEDCEISAVINGVNAEGRLVLQTSEGKKIECSNGEISYLS